MATHPLLPQTRRVIARGMATNRPLTIVVLLMLAVLAGTLVGLVIDPRVITGAPAWLKPAKFAVSISIYCATFVWLLGFVAGRVRLAQLVAWVTAAALVIEMALIALQAFRGTTSHFNVSTPFDGAIWSVMGASIVCLWTASLVLAILLLRQRFADAAFAWSIRLGVFISLIGMGVAFFMTSPTSAQRQAASAGHGMPIAGAHSVGVPDGGPGLPVVGWSTVGGDLRVPHFVGLHALQLLPLLGWLTVRFGGRLRPATRTALVCILGIFYVGLVGILTWQALRGQSVIAPDARTLLALGVLVITCGGAALAAVAPSVGHRRQTTGAGVGELA